MNQLEIRKKGNSEIIEAAMDSYRRPWAFSPLGITQLALSECAWDLLEQIFFINCFIAQFIFIIIAS